MYEYYIRSTWGSDTTVGEPWYFFFFFITTAWSNPGADLGGRPGLGAVPSVSVGYCM